MKTIVNTFTDRSGTRPADCNQVLSFVVDRITKTSKRGTGMRLTPEEVRALDWAIIREEGGYQKDRWLDGAYAELGTESMEVKESY